MMELDRPEIEWGALAKGMGIQATRATDADEFNEQLSRAIDSPGPHLIEGCCAECFLIKSFCTVLEKDNLTEANNRLAQLSRVKSLICFHLTVLRSQVC